MNTSLNFRINQKSRISAPMFFMPLLLALGLEEYEFAIVSSC
jgi:hypothetical protein